MQKSRRHELSILVVILLVKIMLPVCCYGNAEQVYRDYSRSTVVIVGYDAKGKPINQGSGFIVSSDGKVITNYHVISGTREVRVRIDGKEFASEGFLHIDKQNDLALLKINGRNLSPVKIGSAENLSVGQKIYVISSPRGLENSLSEGLISAVRTLGSKKVIQITAPISPGSSGGPVFNEKSEVIAVATFILKESQNVNFAVPISAITDKISFEKALIKKTAPTEDYSKTAEYWLNRCRAYAASHLGEDGINACDRALAIDPDLAEAHVLKGVLYLSLQKVSEAIVSCTKAIELTEDEVLLATAHSLRAFSHTFLGHYPYALSDSTYALKLIREKPENAVLIFWARMARGASYGITGNHDSAIADFDAIMKWKQNISADLLSFTYQYRGHAYFKCGRYPEAIDDYRQNIALCPMKLPDVYRSLGLSYYFLDKKELAIEALQTAARLGDSDAQNFLRALGQRW